MYIYPTLSLPTQVYRLVSYLGSEHGYASISVVCWLRVLGGRGGIPRSSLAGSYGTSALSYLRTNFHSASFGCCHSLVILHLPFFRGCPPCAKLWRRSWESEDRQQGLSLWKVDFRRLVGTAMPSALFLTFLSSHTFLLL